MSVQREAFGVMPNGETVYRYTVTNQNEYAASILTLGATLQAFVAEDKNGELRDVLLGFDTVEEYLTKSDYQGATVGPVCNRIANADLPIGDKHYELTANENGVTSLHSGGEFSFVNWKAIVADANAVEFSYISPDGMGGFPGETQVKVVFSLTDNNELHIRYWAKSNRQTYINLTNHAYFNLNGYSEGNIQRHSLQIASEEFTAVDEKSIPTGTLIKVKGTPFDFTALHPICEMMNEPDEQLKMTGGYDHNFCIANWDKSLKKAATAVGDESGIILNVYTDLPGVQFYAGNFLKGTPGKNGMPMNKHGGFCLETQYYPDTPHRTEFPSCLFDKDEEYVSETVYAFSIAE